MPSINFTPEEFAAVSEDVWTCIKLASNHGYTVNGFPGAGVIHRNAGRNEECICITVDQQDDKASIIANLTAATLTKNLSVEPAEQQVACNNVDTKDYILSGEPGAHVILSFDGTLPADKTSFVLDGAGNGSFTIGPFPPGACTDSDGIKIGCSYSGRLATGCVCIVRVGH